MVFRASLKFQGLAWVAVNDASRHGAISSHTKSQPVVTGWLFKCLATAGSGQQVDGAGLLDRVVDFAMQLGGDSGHAAWQDLAGLRRELGEKLRIGCDDLIGRDIVTAARHTTVRFTEVDTALDCFWLGHFKRVAEGRRLAELAVKGAALEEVIELHFLETTRGAKALFITRGDVT
jgi:hypothetical protein